MASWFLAKPTGGRDGFRGDCQPQSAPRLILSVTMSLNPGGDYLNIITFLNCATVTVRQRWVPKAEYSRSAVRRRS